MANKRRELPEIDKLVRDRGKKFVRIPEGAQLYSIGVNTFRQLAIDAGAIYKIKRIVLVNTEIIDEYLESFREDLF